MDRDLLYNVQGDNEWITWVYIHMAWAEAQALITH